MQSLMSMNVKFDFRVHRGSAAVKSTLQPMQHDHAEFSGEIHFQNRWREKSSEKLWRGVLRAAGAEGDSSRRVWIADSSL